MNKTAYYFIGIGGIGMSSIARFLLNKGALVAGYDKTRTPLTKALEDAGVLITYNEEVEHIPAGFEAETTKVIFTPAIPASMPKSVFEAQGNSLQKRAAFLGEITRDVPTLAVAGTHGKTTTTAILAHLFTATEQSFTAFVGGMVQAAQSNLFLPAWMLCLWRPMNSIALFYNCTPN